MELEVDGKLPFLDVCLIRNLDGNILTSWYMKPTASGRLLNFLSNHHVQNKKNIVLNIFNKKYTLSSDMFIDENVKKAFNILAENNYPKYFVRNIYNKFKENLNNRTRQTSETSTSNMNNNYVKLQYIPGLSNKIKQEFKKFGHRNLVFYNPKTVKSLFTNLKDKDDKELQSNVIYKIDCKNCDGCYIGQTKQYLKKRVYQHKYDCNIVNIDKTEKTALPQHHFDQENHVFNFDEVSIMDKEPNWFKRNVGEMIQIEINTNNINFKTDALKLNPIYKSILHKYRNFRNANTT